MAVDSNHEAFSSEPTIVIGDREEDLPVDMFIAMDPPKHDLQRRAAQPVVAPQNLAQMESLIRSRVVDILDNLPLGEIFNWVDEVSINLTTQMLATLFDFPFEERHKLTYWSDLATGSPQLVGGNVDEEERMIGLMDGAETFTRLWHDRKNPRHHLSFGFGIHRCMGNRLAEMQLRILWEEILQRFSFVE